MAPHQMFLDMFQAMKDEDHATARELAQTLQCWFAKRGFYPAEYSPEAIHTYIASVLSRTAGHQKPELPFSLVCSDCDAGKRIATEVKAMDEGWTEIEPAPCLPQANFLGICPDCNTMIQIPAADTAMDAEIVDDNPFAAGDIKSTGDTADEATEDRQPCPACGEMIKTAASKCRYCGEVFDPSLKKRKSSGGGGAQQ